MVDLGPPPQLYIPARPAIIRAHQGDLDALKWLERERGIEALLPGMAPVVAAGAGAPAGPACSYHPLVKSASSSTSYVFNSTAIGDAASDRLVVVVITTNNGNVSGVTIGGVSATAAVTMANGDENVCIYYLEVASGTTANIVVSTSSALCCSLAPYRLTGLASSTPVSTNSASSLSASGGTISANVNAEAGDVVIAGSIMNAGSVAASWVGVTEQYDESYGSSEYTSGGFAIAGSTETPRSVNVTPSASAKRAIAAAVWR